MSIMDNEGHSPTGLGNTPSCGLCNDTGEQRYWEGRWRDEMAENERLRLENWQLKGALGYAIPGDIPEGNFKCGLCEARATNSAIFGDA